MAINQYRNEKNVYKKAMNYKKYTKKSCLLFQIYASRRRRRGRRQTMVAKVYVRKHFKKMDI